jgi:hypothetical protein
MLRWKLCAISMILVCWLAAVAQDAKPAHHQDSVKQIVIESRWRGMGEPADSRLVVQSRNGSLYLEEKQIELGKIDDLLAALRASALPTPQVTNLGITADWLRQNVKAVPKQGEAAKYYEGAPNQRALYENTFSDLGTIQKLLPSLFGFWKSDDYPELMLTVTFADGRQWTAISDSYFSLMLPWTVDLNGQKRKTYNADISRALGSLMPDGSLNLDRLNDAELKVGLSDEVMQHIQDQWNILGVENRAADSFAKLRRGYQIDHVKISAYRGLDFGYIGNEAGPHEENLQATLRKPSLPSNVAEDVVLLYHEGVVKGAENFADRIAPYEALALSVPWLNQYLAEHPQQLLYIRFVHNRSFSEKAMQNFKADMKELGKEFLADEVTLVQDKAALVFLDYGSDWIILPDKRMILWRHYLPAGFLKWQAADFRFKRCADYNSNNGGCVGAVISAEGVLQP